jgi:hypothetical protein
MIKKPFSLARARLKTLVFGSSVGYNREGLFLRA